MKYQNSIYIILLLSMLCTSCESILNVPEAKNQIGSQLVFADSTNATSAILGAYFTLSAQGSVHNVQLKFTSLYADELNMTTGDLTADEFKQKALSVGNSINKDLWVNLYSVIYQCNSVIEGVSTSKSLSESFKSQLIAEAKFLRGFCYFYLVNTYDNVPLVLTTNVNINRLSSQSSIPQIYESILQDLISAKSSLPASFIGTGKVRASKWSASALLAKVYLYQKNWEEARKESSFIIDSGLFGPLPNLQDVFIANSKEAILQLSSQNGFVSDITAFFPANATAIPNYPFTTSLLQEFESGDGRKTTWISKTSSNIGGITATHYYLSKYKNSTNNTARPEFTMVSRLAEQYLIRAEAHTHLGSLDLAINDLNMLRKRATGIEPLPDNLSESACYIAIEKERVCELFCEWGNRFYDLKRTNKLISIFGTIPTFKSTSVRFPIPQSEITYNPNLIQNEGY